ncbi:MAG: HEPN domain-containing protein [Armatimonadetes bacterium]|nr:HEPN domain-containing protein [Armatimonadota bacterium]
MSERSEYWVELAEYDLETANAMLDTGRYLYVGFMCHQVIEKMMKAYFARVRSEMPPYTHNLEMMAVQSSLAESLTPEQLDLTRRLEPLNVESRYPADRDMLAKALSPEKCRLILDQTTEFYLWIKQKLSE